MGTYQVPRNVKGEGRILFIFSTKALIYSVIGLVVGFLFVLLFGIVNLSIIGYILMILFALAGFVIGTFKMPDTNAFEITKKTGWENIDDVIKRSIKYKRNGGNIYIYKKPEEIKKELEQYSKDKRYYKHGRSRVYKTSWANRRRSKLYKYNSRRSKRLYLKLHGYKGRRFRQIPRHSDCCFCTLPRYVWQ